MQRQRQRDRKTDRDNPIYEKLKVDIEKLR